MFRTFASPSFPRTVLRKSGSPLDGSASQISCLPRTFEVASYRFIANHCPPNPTHGWFRQLLSARCFKIICCSPACRLHPSQLRQLFSILWMRTEHLSSGHYCQLSLHHLLNLCSICFAFPTWIATDISNSSCSLQPVGCDAQTCRCATLSFWQSRESS